MYGGVVLDPDYQNTEGYGEYSYFKPKEAYRIEGRIRREEQRLKSYYDRANGKTSAAGKVLGGSESAAASLMSPVTAALYATNGIDNAIDAVKNECVSPGMAGQFAKRDIANTYVWTADGGFFAQSTEMTDSRTEVSSGSFRFSGSVGAKLSTDIAIFSIGISLEFEAAIGGGMSLTKKKSSETASSYSLNTTVDVPGVLQKHKMDSHGNWIGVIDGSGNPVVLPGKVDAYRLKTFYLDSSKDNFEDLFEKLVDPTWFAESKAANAVAFRQAYQSDKKPPCWRVFHRVTYVSRVLLEISMASIGSVERIMRDNDINSIWELMQQLGPYVENKPYDFPVFAQGVRDNLRKVFPELVPHATDIIKRMAEYYGIEV